MLAAHP
jgi:hypothetical protein